MAEPFLAEVRMFSFDFVPKGWAACNGQLMPIAQNQALFALLGTMYGGNGQTNFALPDLRGRTPIHAGNGHIQGESAGVESVTLTLDQMPQHVHALNASASDGNQPVPGNAVLARSVNNPYNNPANLVPMNAGSVTPVGGGQPHENRMPLLTIMFGIALQGIFPGRN